MTEAMAQPAKRNPQKRAVLPTLPPFSRSRQALTFSSRAAEGRLCLQVCGSCETVVYPAREICPKCWCSALIWTDIADGGRLIAETVLRTSINTYFRERMPWRVGTVEMDAGPTALMHLHGDVEHGAQVKIIARTDKSGQGVLFALPKMETPNMADDRQLRALTCDPKFRRALVTDGRSAIGQATVRALSAAGATQIFVGVAEQWRPFEGAAELAAMPKVEILPLDVTDTDSVNELVGEIGGRTDILINTTEHVRPGASMERNNVLIAREEMETNYFGLMRLIQAFGPALRARGADGDNSACAWVNLLSVYALSNWPTFGTTSASQAAAFSLSQCLRGEFAGSGVKVINILTGPTEDAWHQPLPAPKVTAEGIAKAIVRSLQQGIETMALGAVAEDVLARWREDPTVLERELTQVAAGASR